MTRLITLFTEHPQSVNETYLEHTGFALRFAFWLAVAAGAALVHAILPFMFEKTASKIIDRLHARIHRRVDAAAAGIAAE